jgi:hypothetical protein
VIEFPRSLARALRAAFRRSAWARAGRGLPPPAVFSAGDGGLLVHTQADGLAAQYRRPGPGRPCLLALPGDALRDWEGRGDAPVRLGPAGPGRASARWDDAGVPRAAEYDLIGPDKLPPPPPEPVGWLPAGPGLLDALYEAARTAAQAAVRYALGHVQLRGKSGEAAATDGKQLLLQSGFRFPWKDEALVPRVLAFGLPEVAGQEDVAVGRTERHVVIRAGPWAFHLPVEDKARFPRVEDALPRLTPDAVRLRVGEADAAFLARALPRLPDGPDNAGAVTLDLGPAVCLRAREAGPSRATELVLAGSAAAGKPLRVLLDRRRLLRSLELGFREVVFADADRPAVCRGGRRVYAWVLLDANAALPPGPDDLRIRSAAAGAPAAPPPPPPDPEVRRPAPAAPPAPPRDPETKTPAAAVGGPAPAPAAPPPSDPETRTPTVTTPHANGGPGDGRPAGRPEAAGYDALLEEALALQDALRGGLARAGRLLAALKQLRRQSRLVEGALATLRQLEPPGR